jgi:hypothetical protein
METNTGYPNRTHAPETEQKPDSLKTEAKQEAEYLPTKKAGTHIQTQKMLFLLFTLCGRVVSNIYYWSGGEGVYNHCPGNT